MGNGSKGDVKYRRNGAGLGRNVQGDGAVGDIVRQRDMGGDGRDAQDPGGVPHREVRWITRLTEKRGAGGEWEYPPVVEATKGLGIHPIGECTRRRQANMSERVDCRSIYELCMEAERRPGTSRMVRRWDQDAANAPDEWTNIWGNLI